MNGHSLEQNILLCDLGGTHARFARYVSEGNYDHFKKYRLRDFTAFEDIIQAYYNDTDMQFDAARFATATYPVNGIVEYKRFSGDPLESINFNVCQEKFHWDEDNVHYFNDLEAGAYGLAALSEENTNFVCGSKGSIPNHHKLWVSIGTGIGHAALLDDHRVINTMGGHFLPVTVTEEHRKIEAFIRSVKNQELSLIAEDFVSARGLRMITEIFSGQNYDDIAPDDFLIELAKYPDVIRIFYEFLGIYAQTLVTVTGFYGGVYLGGGVIDHLIKNNLTDWAAFEKYFRPNMVSIVKDRLESTPVYHVLYDEMPLLGLTTLNTDF